MEHTEERGDLMLWIDRDADILSRYDSYCRWYVEEGGLSVYFKEAQQLVDDMATMIDLLTRRVYVEDARYRKDQNVCIPPYEDVEHGIREYEWEKRNTDEL